MPRSERQLIDDVISADGTVCAGFARDVGSWPGRDGVARCSIDPLKIYHVNTSLDERNAPYYFFKTKIQIPFLYKMLFLKFVDGFNNDFYKD